jgi:hypothetical protein
MFGLCIRLFLLAALLLGANLPLSAQVTLLLGEPYSYDGAFAGTGHSAVYLSRICADGPLKLRRCEPGEWGAVVSRYHRMGGYDWMAVPFIPYLYAVKNPEDVPIYADPKLVAFLREQYLKQWTHDLPGEPVDVTTGSWYELAGSAYDRTIYAYKIETTPEQDDAFIRQFNAGVNTASYNLIKRNCADFVKDIINFYYPKATHRSIINDLGVTTPRQVAKSLVKYGKHHEQVQLSPFIIPQVAGMKRSRPIHGVIDSVLLAKKYMMPLMLLHPVMAGGASVGYWLGWRFHPAKNAMVFNPRRSLETPLTAKDRDMYKKLLADVRKSVAEDQDSSKANQWERAMSAGTPTLDRNGRLALRLEEGDQTVEIGLCRENLLSDRSSPELVQDLLINRLEEQLRSGSPRASASDIQSDWKLLRQTMVLDKEHASTSAGGNSFRH